MMVQADQPPSTNHGQFALGGFSLNQTLKSLYLPLAIWNKQSAQALAQPHPFGVFQGSCRVNRLTMLLFSQRFALDPGLTARCR
ncbi:hypothetical protein, partial [Pseudomonas syringae]|uniref:hypothetical protein n=1 Tax=Pseudomonas syringae TaxID=317 RepID=UPI001C650AA1